MRMFLYVKCVIIIIIWMFTMTLAVLTFIGLVNRPPHLTLSIIRYTITNQTCHVCVCSSLEDLLHNDYLQATLTHNPHQVGAYTGRVV